MSDITKLGWQHHQQQVVHPAIRGGRASAVGETGRTHRDHKTLDPDALESLIGRVSIHLREGNFEAAVVVINKAAADEETAILRPEETPLCDILGVRITNQLEEHFKALFVKDVLKLSNAQLMGVPNVNLGTIRDIDIALGRLRLRRRG